MANGKISTDPGVRAADSLAKHRDLLNGVISYLERLGVCVATLAGSAAIIHFRVQLLEAFPVLPLLVGIVLLFASLYLTVWVAADQFVRLPPIKSRVMSFAVSALILVPSIFLVIAALFVAIKGFSS